MPKTQKILFNECQRAAKNALQLSRCVAAVLDARDQLKLYEQKPADPECAPDESDGNWVMALVRAAYRKWNCRNGVQFSISNKVPRVEQTAVEVERHASEQTPLKYTTDQLKFTRTLISSKSKKEPHMRRPLQIEKLPLHNSTKEMRRNKRSIRDISPRCLTPKSVKRLRTIRSQFVKLNHVLKYIYGVTKSNQKLVFITQLQCFFKRVYKLEAKNPFKTYKSRICLDF